MRGSTLRYAVAPWPPGWGLPSTVPDIEKVGEENSFVTVAEAQRRYWAGERSKRWWYRMAETGKIAHHRVGDSILFRTDDIEEFIADSRKGEHVESPRPEPAPAIPVVPTPVKHQPQGKPGEEVGFRFFPR
jgi:excisionase family DNA binding protein